MINTLKSHLLMCQAKRLRRIINSSRVSNRDACEVAKLRDVALKLKSIFLESIDRNAVNGLSRAYGRRIFTSSAAVRPPKPKLPIGLALSCLAELREVIETSQVKAFLVSGTLLGCIRESRILAHDYDLDVGVNIDDPRRGALIAALNNHPSFKLSSIDRITNEIAFQNVWARSHANKPWIAKYKYKDCIPIDLFVHVFSEDGVYHGSKRNLWINSRFDLSTAELCGHRFFIPRDAETYLTENYGDWRTPVTGFQCTTDTPNSLPMHSLASIKFLMKRYIMLGERNDTERQAIVLNRIKATFG